MAIKDWPARERPRERLLAQGPGSLSDAELLAIFLRTGVRGKTAVDLARELLERFGSLRRLLAADTPSAWRRDSAVPSLRNCRPCSRWGVDIYRNSSNEAAPC